MPYAQGTRSLQLHAPLTSTKALVAMPGILLRWILLNLKPQDSQDPPWYTCSAIDEPVSRKYSSENLQYLRHKRQSHLSVDHLRSQVGNGRFSKVDLTGSKVMCFMGKGDEGSTALT